MNYDEPFDFGVMQGPNISEDTFVGKNYDQPTCFYADRKRMRWALQHTSVLQRTQRICRGGDMLPFAYQLLDLNPVRIPTVDSREIGLREWLSLTETDGFIAVYLSRRCGPIVATEQYSNGLKPNCPHLLYSASKSLAVGLVAVALDRGMLRRDERVGDVVPELSKSGVGDAALDDVLNMASGAKWYAGDRWTPQSSADFGINHFFAGGFLVRDQMDPALRDGGYMRFLSTVEKERDHGVAFNYKAIDTHVAVTAAQRRFGRPICELLSDLIWSRIGAEHDAYICCDQYGTSLTPFGVSATLRDCARWGLMHLKDADRHVLPEHFVEGLIEPHPTYASPASRIITPHPVGYRDQYWVYPSGTDGGFYANGWLGQSIRIFPTLNVVLVQLATLYPDNYKEQIPDGAAFHHLAVHISQAYSQEGL